MTSIAPFITAVSVAAFVYPWRDEIRPRAAALKHGARGVKFVPVAWLVAAPVLAGAAWAASRIPLLQWSLFSSSGNILVSSLAPATGSTGSSAAGATQLGITLAGVAALIAALVVFFIVMNYEEEEWGRDSWGHVAAWAVTHLVMGIPVFAVAAIFSVGVVYKQIHDRYGFDEAYAAHVATNTSLVIGLAAISITLTVIG